MKKQEENEKLELFELLLYALDGTISDEQFARLENLLSEKPGAVEDYVRFIMIYATLNQSKDNVMATLPSIAEGAQEINRDLLKAIEHDEQAALENVVEEAFWQVKAREEKIKVVAETVFEKFKAEERRRQQELAYKQYRAQRRRLISAVVSLTVLLTVVVFAWLSGLKQPSSPRETIPTPAPPPVVAMVTNVYNAQWGRSDALVIGTELTPGSLNLEAGVVEITFENETTLILEAPVEANLVTERLMLLSLGTVTAHVSSSAYGFQIETPSVCVTDLGTRFGMVVLERGVTDIHVFKGCVAASFESPQQNERDRIKTLYTNDAMRFDAEADKAESIEADLQQFALSWNDVLYRPRTTGPVRFEYTPSTTFLQDGNDTYVAVLLERTNRYIPYDFSVDIINPGDYREFKDMSETISVGTRVDSYLIHWNPTSQPAFQKTMAGSVTFTRPILGLIVKTKKLLTSRRLFKNPDILYPDNDNQGLESPNSINADTVMLSQDRHKLSFTFRAQQMDQIRILVSTAGTEAP